MLREIDTRKSGAYTIELFDDDEVPDFYLIFIKDEDGMNVSSIGAKSKVEAIEAFHHPFSYSYVPNVFATTTTISVS